MPSDKRARQRAGRAARMAQLQQAQRRRQRVRRGVIIGLIIAAAIGLAVYTSTSGGSGKKASTSSTTAHSTTTAGTTTTVALGTGLKAHPAPAVSASCHTPASGTAGSGAAPASGRAVSIVPAPAHVPFPNLNGTSPRYTKFSSAPPFCIDVNKTYTVTMTTDVGTVAIRMLPRYAPVTVNNFVFLAGYHFFDGITFHRVIQGFMNQSGDPTATGSGGPGYTIPDEYPSSSAAYRAGAVAMANTGQAHSGGSQFFIVVPGGGSQLSPAYTVFGQVTSGMNVVEEINANGSAASSQTGTPAVYHKIINMTVTES